MRLEKKQLINDIGAILEKSDFIYMMSYKDLKLKTLNSSGFSSKRVRLIVMY